jgi:hypothetical protein
MSISIALFIHLNSFEIAKPCEKNEQNKRFVSIGGVNNDKMLLILMSKMFQLISMYMN